MRFLYIVISLIACSAIANTPVQSSKKPTVNIGITAPLNSLHPLKTFSQDHPFVHYFLHKQIVELNHTWQWECSLCTSIPTLENGGIEVRKENKQTRYWVTWQIRKSAKWGDGTPITPADIIFSWRVAKAASSHLPNIHTHSDLETIEAHPTDPQTVIFKMLNLEYDYSHAAQFPLLPAAHEEPIYNKYADDLDAYFKYSKYSQSPKLPSLYSGSFIPLEWQKNLWLSLGKPGITQEQKMSGQFALTIHSFQSQKAMIAALKTGKVNFVAEETLEKDLFVKNFGKGPLYTPYKEALTTVSVPTDSLEQLTINLRNPVLADSRVRRALWLATDLTELFKNSGIDDVKPSSNFFHDSEFKDRRHSPLQTADIAAANSLLDKAGWDRKGDVRKKGKQILNLTIATNQSNNLRTKLAQELTMQWKKIGVNAKVMTKPDQSFFTSILRRASFPDLALFAWKSPPDTPPRVLFHSRNIPDQNNGYNGQNLGGWRNRLVDQTLDKLIDELSQEKRRDHYETLSAQFARDIPLIPLFHHQETLYIPRWLKGVRWGGHRTPASYGADSWLIETYANPQLKQ